ncbi:MAG: phosphoglycerate mutase family protein [Clostridia bacterium]|nr:phosphoglycerate mutase family protein [Clostridia bacterium]
MKIYFIRHGETPAVKEGLAQGQSNDIELNTLTSVGVEQLEKTATELVEILKEKGVSAENVKLYHCDDKRCTQSAYIVYKALFEAGLLLNENEQVLDVSGRNYGEIEGLNESKIRDMSNLLKPMRKEFKLLWSYLLSEFGFSNPAGIEKKSGYDKKVEEKVLYQLFDDYEPDQTIIIVGNSDVFNVLQKNKSIRKYLYFGNEYMEGKKVKFPKIKIKPGEMVDFELEPLPEGYETVAEMMMHPGESIDYAFYMGVR